MQGGKKKRGKKNQHKICNDTLACSLPIWGMYDSQYQKNPTKKPPTKKTNPKTHNNKNPQSSSSYLSTKKAI